MAISRLQAALASATNEVTVAAANLNFDFTLVRCEAPREYQDLGKVLSKKRKEQAEMGSPHTTARRLGALFEGICPPTPNLIKAYGTRVSEIAEASKKLSEPNEGVFAEHAGVDGTSIWAAATSSSTALHVQLLACMLARVWSAKEATSIWFELVKERRDEIAKKFENEEEIHISALTAATQAEISRSSLAEWDSSARAWLRTADLVKIREQTQLRLILANVNIPVSKDMVVLSSVMEAWRSALRSMENLITGMPQAINKGPTLLALSAWHLYPDLLVVGKDSAEVRFGDKLISTGGVVTFGLIGGAEEESEENRGVYWSLSLKHLNYYGRPVQTEARLDQEFSKVTFPQFTQAVLGCLLGKWGLINSTVDEAAHLFIAFQAAAGRAVKDDSVAEETRTFGLRFLRDTSHWWNIMGDAAWAYLDPANEGREVARKLVKLGLRRSSKFLPDAESSTFFGLSNPATLLACLKGADERVRFLRHIAATSTRSQNDPVIIQYFHEKSPEDQVYATSVPLLQPLQKRKREREAESGEYSHQRWLRSIDPSEYPDENVCVLDENIHFHRVAKYDRFDMEYTFWHHQRQVEFNCIYGDPKLAGLFHDKRLSEEHFRLPTIKDIIWCLNEDMFSVRDFLSNIEGVDLHSQLIKAMGTISMASKVYRVLPSATVSIETLNKPLLSTKWGKAYIDPDLLSATNHSLTNKFRGATLNRQLALSCIAYLGSGVDIAPSLLVKAFGLAYEDSLYMAMQLTCDPWEAPEDYEFKRVLGSVGRAGITLFVPPQSPITRDIDPSSWSLINSHQFNGHKEDHFGKTSLHLSFTNYYVPLYQTAVHGQDHEVYVLESVVSVHDSGAWVADVDILNALGNRQVGRLIPFSCYHIDSCDDDMSTMVSAESWDEILDNPKESFVVRAHGNWIARLAGAAVVSQTLLSGREAPTADNVGDVSFTAVIICPRDLCWRCAEPSRRFNLQTSATRNRFLQCFIF